MPVDPSYGERLARQVADLFAAAELSLLRRIARALARDADAPTWATDRLTQLDLLRARMTRETTELTEQATGTLQHVIATAWTRGQALAVADLDNLDLDVRLPPARLAGIERLAAETLSVIAPVGQRMLRSALDIYTQVVAEASSVVLLGSGTRIDAAQHALDRLTAKGVTSFTDTRGRQWSADTYVSMAVRTGAGRAAVQGHMEQLQANNLDLVMISDSPRECSVCREFEGKILSISGGVVGTVEAQSATSDDTVSVRVYDTMDGARAKGLFHPNCRHSASAYLPGASRPATNTRDTDDRYAEEQRQRQIERHIRAWKRRAATALTPEVEKQANTKVRAWQAAMREHLATTEGLTRKSVRESIGKAH